MSKILVFNAGSSTLKCSLFESSDKIGDDLWRSLIEAKSGHFHIKVYTCGKEAVYPLSGKSLADAMREIGSFLDKKGIEAVGHRVVHGGEEFTEPVILNARSIQKIKKLSYLAPLHNPVNLQGIEIARSLFPKIPQAAVFDTAFHSRMPESSIIYPGPYEWFKRGIRRFGFHGINHYYCMERVAELLDKKITQLRLITCHLGNGCSLAAITKGHSIDTTMGFTPMEGLMMGTRSGSIDPGILFYLMKKEKISATSLEELLNHNSGLKGIGKTQDMRDILKRMQEGDKNAKLAFELFIHSIVKNIAAMAASLGGLDLLVFSGGIGENSKEVRESVCEKLSFLGIKLNRKKNSLMGTDALISDSSSIIKVFAIKAKEDWMIAKETHKLLSS